MMIEDEQMERIHGIRTRLSDSGTINADTDADAGASGEEKTIREKINNSSNLPHTN